MKKQFFALIGLALATAPVYAQTIRVKANVPFEFIVGQQKLPAGEYTIQSINLDGSVLELRDSDQQANGMVITNRCESLRPSAQTRLIFHRYGNRYFLAQIWAAGNSAGRELPKSRRELDLANIFSVQGVVSAATR
jgi:hypothetical protein